MICKLYFGVSTVNYNTGRDALQQAGNTHIIIERGQWQLAMIRFSVTQ
jgi:hypothetical protein